MRRSRILEKGEGHSPFEDSPIRQSLRLAQRKHGKPVLSQCLDMARLALANGKLSPKEYFAYGLYDDARFTFAQKQAFVGRGAQIALNHICNDPHWRAIANDKLVFAATMQAHGFPVARILALHHGFRSLRSSQALRNPEQLERFLRDSAGYPFFSKPVSGMFSAGVARLEGFDPRSNELILARTGRVPLARFVKEAVELSGLYDGYFFQELLHPNDQVREICGDRIATVRVVVLLRASGPEIIRAAWKFPAGQNIADNFWRPGNLMASIDVESGRVVRVVCGVGLDQAVLQHHPDTGKLIHGITLAGWASVRKLCLAAATTLPGLRIQAWDVALCADGPLLGELNIGGGYRIPQTADDVGMLDPKFRRFLDEQVPSWEWRVPWLVLKRSVGSRITRVSRALRRRRERH